MSNKKILPVILSGGFGTRLWPLSRQQMPKQFLTQLFGKDTLFSKALKLTSNRDIFLPPIAVTNKDHKFFVLQEYKDLGIDTKSIILEPCSKNTAAAILAACFQAIKVYDNEEIELLILPSDHLISPRNLFEKSILNGSQATNNNIVTFGVIPTFASTGYGYIRKDQKITDNCFSVKNFLEKPNLKNANKIYKDSDYLWNAGIFLFKANKCINEATKYLPDQVKIIEDAIESSKQDGVFCQIEQNDYEKAQDISIDYAVLEKSDNIATTSLESNWSDVGDFSAIYNEKEKDLDGNVKIGNVNTYNSKNCLINSNKSLIACLGLNNIIAIETDDAFLIADKDHSQDVKNIAKDLLKNNKDEIKLHNRVFRPWGYYETLSCDSNFKVKRILVNPGASLSLQMHNFRSEHWVVTKGTATIQNGEDILELEQGKSTFIPVKCKHRLSNNTLDNLEIIEVQMGESVEESDIIRFDDNYGRS